MTKKLASRRPAGPAEAGEVQTQPEIASDSLPAEQGAEPKPADRYLAQLEALCNDAARNDAFAVLVDVMAWYLARIAVSRTDPTVATADITRVFGVRVQPRRRARAGRAGSQAEGSQSTERVGGAPPET
jgi:hypothetical protein